MNVLFYSKMKDGPGRRLQNVVETQVPVKGTKICRDIESLSCELRQPAHGLSLAIILAASREDLLDILSIGDLLGDLRIILVLPDAEKDTVAKGHKLLPRFLTYADGDFLDVAAVLSRMLGDSYLRKGAKGYGYSACRR